MQRCEALAYSYTEDGIQVLTLANEAATLFHHNYIGTEHLLIGVTEVSPAKDILEYVGVNPDKVNQAVEFILGRGDPNMIHGHIDLTPRSKKVLELAMDEAGRIGTAHLDENISLNSIHILLGLVREGEGIGAGVLESLGANQERLRSEVRRYLMEVENVSSSMEFDTKKLSQLRSESRKAISRIDRMLADSNLNIERRIRLAQMMNEMGTDDIFRRFEIPD